MQLKLPLSSSLTDLEYSSALPAALSKALRRPAIVYEAEQSPGELQYMEETAAHYNKRFRSYEDVVTSRQDGNGSREEESYCLQLDELRSADDIHNSFVLTNDAVLDRSCGAMPRPDAEYDLDSMLELVMADSIALVSCPSAISDHSIGKWDCEDDAVIGKCQHSASPVICMERAVLPAHSRDGTALMCNPSGDIAAEELLDNRELQMVANTSCCAKEHNMDNIPLSSAVLAQQCKKWAGPTLTEVETALGMPSTTSVPPASSLLGTSWSFVRGALSRPYLSYSISDILQNTRNIINSQATIKEAPVEEDDNLCTWRKVMQKRSHMEPQYTVKVRCEEDAVNDGYRWRKYGQKSIKNSPFPRSYYRCSSGKCSVKKKVERCSEDAGLLLVSYEGVHLHHRPTSLAARPCSPTSGTCQASPPPTSTRTTSSNCSPHMSSSSSSSIAILAPAFAPPTKP